MTKATAEFYTKLMGETQGPFTAEQIRALAQKGHLLPDTLVRKGRQGSWVTADRIKGLSLSPKHSPPETCENCGRAIGRLETLDIYNDHVVCGECVQRLAPQSRVGPSAQSRTTWLWIGGVLLLMAGLGSFRGFPDLLAAPFLIIAGALLLPPVWSAVAQKWPSLSMRSGLIRTAACALAFATVGVVMPSTPADKSPSPETISYTVLSEEVDESPGKTQLKMDILVPEEASADELRALLNSLYQQASSRTGFQYHTHPTVIAVYAYPSREHAASGMGQWTAMLSKTPQNQEPKIQMHSSVSHEAVAKESRFGYSLEERKEIYKRIVGAEDRGQKEAEQRYPNDLQRQFDYADELTDKYKNELVGELGLSLEQLKQIGWEGVLSNWAMPQMP